MFPWSRGAKFLALVVVRRMRAQHMEWQMGDFCDCLRFCNPFCVTAEVDPSLQDESWEHAAELGPRCHPA